LIENIAVTMEGLFGSSFPDFESARAAVDQRARELGACFNIRKHERSKAGFHHSTVLAYSKGRKFVSQAGDDTAKSK